MTLFILKWIATITMTLDHVGVHFFGNLSTNAYSILRSIGRIAFPLYAFFISQGYKHTSNKLKYFIRLAVLAVGTELVLGIIALVLQDTYYLTINIFITLAIGLGCIMLIDNKRWYVKIISVPIIVSVLFIRPEYGLYGVFLIIVFWIADRMPNVAVNMVVKTLGLVLLNAVFIHLVKLSDWTYLAKQAISSIQWLSVLALIPMLLYNGQYGITKHKKFWQYFFYAYYPLHIGIIALFAYVI